MNTIQMFERRITNFGLSDQFCGDVSNWILCYDTFLHILFDFWPCTLIYVYFKDDYRPANRPVFWRDSPAFLLGVLNPTKSWKYPAIL